MDNVFMQVIGNIGKGGVELQYTDTGKLLAKSSVAVEVGYGDNKDTEWMSVVVWGEVPAQRFHDFCQKGTKVYLSGTPKVNVWKSKDGEVKGQINLNVKEFRVLKDGKPKDEEESTPYDGE